MYIKPEREEGMSHEATWEKITQCRENNWGKVHKRELLDKLEKEQRSQGYWKRVNETIM